MRRFLAEFTCIKVPKALQNPHNVLPFTQGFQGPVGLSSVEVCACVKKHTIHGINIIVVASLGIGASISTRAGGADRPRREQYQQWEPLEWEEHKI